MNLFTTPFGRARSIGQASGRHLRLLLGHGAADERILLAVVITDSARRTPEARLQPKSMQHPCILIANDNRTDRVIVQGMSRDAQAVDLYKSNAPDLLVMDISMSGTDGTAATALNRRHQAETGAVSVPVIAPTDHAYPGMEHPFTQSGFDDALAKSLMKPDLLNVVGWQLAARAQRFADDRNTQRSPSDICG